MRKILTFSVIVMVFLLHQENTKADWVNVTNEIFQLNINAVTSTGNYIFAGNNQALFRSSNNGNNWQQVYYLSTLALASNENYVYHGYENGLSYSTNYGANWSFGYFGGGSQWITSILTNGNYVYAGCFYPVLNSTNKGVWISSNYGANWTQTVLNNINIYALTFTGTHLYATGYTSGIGSGVYLTTNNGQNWTNTLSIDGNTLAANGSIIYMGGSGVYKSTNYGENWTQTSLNTGNIEALVVLSNIVFAGGGGPSSFYLSTDNGTTWIPRMEGMPYYVNALCVSNGYIFAGTDGMGVFRRPLSELVGIEPISNNIPIEIRMLQNYPNPFNPVTHIGFEISKLRFVSLKIFDGLGKEISTLVKEELRPGSYEVTWNGSNYSSGVYFYQLAVDNKIIETKKMILSK